MPAKNHLFHEIGIIHSCFGQRFPIPRQAGLAPSATGRLELHDAYAIDAAFRGIEAFSHLWIIWIPHASLGRRRWRPTVRPPRLGGRRRLGVFATRSPFRPNPIALSSVKLEGIVRQQGRLWLELSGIDMLDGTPVLDIKPYIPYADRIDAQAGFADLPPRLRSVTISPALSQRLNDLTKQGYTSLERLIIEILAQDPRPAQKDSPDHVMRLHDFDIHWHVEKDGAIVVTAFDEHAGDTTCPTSVLADGCRKEP